MENEKRNMNFNALQCLESLSQKVKKSKLTVNFMESIKDESTEICNFLNCSIEQVVIFSVILYLNINRKDARIDSICKYIGCSPFYLLSKTNDLEDLIDKEYIQRAFKRQMILLSSSEFDVHYLINDEIMNSLITNNFEHRKTIDGLSTHDFLFEVDQKVWERYHNEASYNFLLRKVKRLKDANPDCNAVKAARKFILSNEEEIVAYMICFATIGRYEIGLKYLLKYVFDSERRKSSFERCIVYGQSMLDKFGLINYTTAEDESDINLSMPVRGLKAFLGEEYNIYFKPDET
ncbi:MAG: hypothetical protein ACOYLE_04175 [Bacteroidales bacterium]